MIDVVKDQLDVGLLTANPRVLDFWRDEIGLRFDHALPIAEGHVQHRFEERGSVIKLNLVERLAGEQRSGIEELWIERAGLEAERATRDPDGNRVRLVPSGTRGVHQLGVRIAVPQLERSLAHYRGTLGFAADGDAGARCGDTVLLFEERADAPSGFDQAGRGWLYLTVQVRNCDEEVARVDALGAEVVVRPRNLGEVARIAMVRDPDGNLLEISQRASLVGPLPTG